MKIDPILQFIQEAAQKEPKIVRVRLFGSRARGDHRDRSDYDLAVDAPSWSYAEWARWSEKSKEDIPTLAGLDLVWIQSDSSPELLRIIESEGKEIYPKCRV